jgi:hypothetical protein
LSLVSCLLRELRAVKSSSDQRAREGRAGQGRVLVTFSPILVVDLLSFVFEVLLKISINKLLSLFNLLNIIDSLLLFIG